MYIQYIHDRSSRGERICTYTCFSQNIKNGMCFEEACARLPRAESSKPMKDPYSMQLVSEAYGLTPVGSKPKRKPVWVNVNKPGKVTVGIENTSNDTIRDMMIVFLLLAVFGFAIALFLS